MEVFESILDEWQCSVYIETARNSIYMYIKGKELEDSQLVRNNLATQHPEKILLQSSENACKYQHFGPPESPVD